MTLFNLMTLPWPFQRHHRGQRAARLLPERLLVVLEAPSLDVVDFNLKKLHSWLYVSQKTPMQFNLADNNSSPIM